MSVYNTYLTFRPFPIPNRVCVSPSFHTPKIDSSIPRNAGHKSGVADPVADMSQCQPPPLSDARLDIYRRHDHNSIFGNGGKHGKPAAVSCRSLRKEGEDEGKFKLMALMINS
jgi:hypothetical protein